MIPFYKKIKLDNQSIIQADNCWDSISEYFTEKFGYENFFTTKSCTQSLELAIMSLNLPQGQEVIIPSYGFVSLANAVVINGLKCVFVDCEPNTMNIDVQAAIHAISDKTAAVITINYGGVACDYGKLIPVCKEKGIAVIEDNAHGIRAKYQNEWLGKFGDISTISFDYLKNISCEEGGGISINDERLLQNFEIAYHFGSNRASMYRGEVTYYEWKGKGMNAILAQPLTQILYRQLIHSVEIIEEFRTKWEFYYQSFLDLYNREYIDLPIIPKECTPNGHMFWIKAKDRDERERLIQFLSEKEIETAFHYTPLHQSEFGKKEGEYRGEDKFTTKDSSRILRLPLYYNLSKNEQVQVVERIYEYYAT